MFYLGVIEKGVEELVGDCKVVNSWVADCGEVDGDGVSAVIVVAGHSSVNSITPGLKHQTSGSTSLSLR